MMRSFPLQPGATGGTRCRYLKVSPAGPAFYGDLANARRAVAHRFQEGMLNAELWKGLNVFEFRDELDWRKGYGSGCHKAPDLFHRP
jgi:hypothetical protein